MGAPGSLCAVLTLGCLLSGERCPPPPRAWPPPPPPPKPAQSPAARPSRLESARPSQPPLPLPHICPLAALPPPPGRRSSPQPPPRPLALLLLSHAPPPPSLDKVSLPSHPRWRGPGTCFAGWLPGAGGGAKRRGEGAPRTVSPGWAGQQGWSGWGTRPPRLPPPQQESREFQEGGAAGLYPSFATPTPSHSRAARGGGSAPPLASPLVLRGVPAACFLCRGGCSGAGGLPLLFPNEHLLRCPPEPPCAPRPNVCSGAPQIVCPKNPVTGPAFQLWREQLAGLWQLLREGPLLGPSKHLLGGASIRASLGLGRHTVPRTLAAAPKFIGGARWSFPPPATGAGWAPFFSWE